MTPSLPSFGTGRTLATLLYPGLPPPWLCQTISKFPIQSNSIKIDSVAVAVAVAVTITQEASE